MRQLITDSIIGVYQEKITLVKREMGVSVHFVWCESDTKCPNCKWSAMNNASSNVYQSGGAQPFSGICPVCSGSGKFVVMGEHWASGTTYYRGSRNQLTSIPGGIDEGNQTIVSFLIQDVSVNSGKFSGVPAYKVAEYTEFDGERWIVDGLPMFGGIGPRFIVDCNFMVTNKRKLKT